jgi:hypothetical protein
VPGGKNNNKSNKSLMLIFCKIISYNESHMSIATNTALKSTSVPDIAVGAPYEGNGVVYIYHGNVDGIKHKAAQVLQAEDIDVRIKGFGISLSKGVDIDGNQYNGMYTDECKHSQNLKKEEVSQSVSQSVSAYGALDYTNCSGLTC